MTILLKILLLRGFIHILIFHEQSYVLPTELKCGFLEKSFIMSAPLKVEHSSYHFLVGLLLHPPKSDDWSVQLTKVDSL